MKYRQPDYGATRTPFEGISWGILSAVAFFSLLLAAAVVSFTYAMRNAGTVMAAEVEVTSAWRAESLALLRELQREWEQRHGSDSLACELQATPPACRFARIWEQGGRQETAAAIGLLAREDGATVLAAALRAGAGGAREEAARYLERRAVLHPACLERLADRIDHNPPRRWRFSCRTRAEDQAGDSFDLLNPLHPLNLMVLP